MATIIDEIRAKAIDLSYTPKGATSDMVELWRLDAFLHELEKKNADNPETISEAKKYLRENWEKGVDCPCCNRLVKLYPRKITSAMAWVLILLYKYFRKPVADKWLHVEDYLKKQDIPSSLRGDFAKLKHWGLLEAMVSRRDDGSSRVGFYRITEKGRQFARGAISVPRTAYLHHQKFYGYGEEETDIKLALGDKFNFKELMGDYLSDSSQQKLI